MLIRDTIKTILYLGSIDTYLMGLKSAIRRGHLHPIISERVKLAGHIRENFKVLGIKRVSKQASLEDYVNEKYGDKDDGKEESEE